MSESEDVLKRIVRIEKVLFNETYSPLSSLAYLKQEGEKLKIDNFTSNISRLDAEIYNLKAQVSRFRSGCMLLIGILIAQLLFSAGNDIWRFLHAIFY